MTPEQEIEEFRTNALGKAKRTALQERGAIGALARAMEHAKHLTASERAGICKMTARWIREACVRILEDIKQGAKPRTERIHRALEKARGES